MIKMKLSPEDTFELLYEQSRKDYGSISIDKIKIIPLSDDMSIMIK